MASRVKTTDTETDSRRMYWITDMTANWRAIRTRMVQLCGWIVCVYTAESITGENINISFYISIDNNKKLT